MRDFVYFVGIGHIAVDLRRELGTVDCMYFGGDLGKNFGGDFGKNCHFVGSCCID